MKRSLLSAILLLLSLSLPGQERYRWFHHIQASPDDVRTISPDASGRVWFGTTRGLFRYGDAPEGIRYDLLPDILQQGVNEIYPFDGGRKLVRTRDGALWVYGPVDNTALPFQDFLTEWGLDIPADWDLNVRAYAEDDLWFYRQDRLYRKGPEDGKASLVARLPGAIRSIDSDGREVCVVTDSLICLSPVDFSGQVRTVPHGLEFHRSGVWCALDGERNVWLGSEGLSASRRRHCAGRPSWKI